MKELLKDVEFVIAAILTISMIVVSFIIANK